MARSTQTDSAVVDTRPEVASVCALATSATASSSHPGEVRSLRPGAMVRIIQPCSQLERPRDSARKTASIARVCELADRPDLEHPDACRWESRGDRAGLVHVLGLDDEVPAQLLFRLGKGAAGCGDLPGLDADGPSRAGPLQGVRGDVVAVPFELLGVLDRGVDERLHLLLGHRLQHLLVVVDREHELHRILLSALSGVALASFSRRYQPDPVMWRGVRARAGGPADTARSPARP